MPITLRESSEARLIERERPAYLKQIHTIIFIDGLAQQNCPTIVALHQKVIEAAAAGDVDPHVVNQSPLKNRHLRLA